LSIIAERTHDTYDGECHLTDAEADRIMTFIRRSRSPVTSPDTILVEALAEIERLTKLLNTPEVDDFTKAVPLEAAHQRERWSTDHDAGKTPFDWFWLVGYLAQKAASSAIAGNVEKAKHHTISTAAALANWHLALSGGDTRMRPGVDPERVQNGGAGLSDPPNDPEREQAA
jgi:hypothetical protein